MAIHEYNVKVLSDGTCIIDGRKTATDAATLWTILHSAPPAFTRTKIEGIPPAETIEAFLSRGGKITDVTQKGISLESLGL